MPSIGPENLKPSGDCVLCDSGASIQRPEHLKTRGLWLKIQRGPGGHGGRGVFESFWWTETGGGFKWTADRSIFRFIEISRNRKMLLYAVHLNPKGGSSGQHAGASFVFSKNAMPPRVGGSIGPQGVFKWTACRSIFRFFEKARRPATFRPVSRAVGPR